MLLHELERAVAEMLVANAGPIADGMGGFLVDNDGNPISGPLPAVGPTFRIYRGENNADVLLPCSIVVAAEGEEDYDTGNMMVDLVVETRIHANAIPGVIDTPLEFGRAIADAITSLLMLSSLPSEINIYAGNNLTVIGLAGARSQGVRALDNAIVYECKVRLYCANANVR
jgi:hypothetical protein